MNGTIRSAIINDILNEETINTICYKYKISKQELSNMLKTYYLKDFHLHKEVTYDGDLFFTGEDLSYYTLHEVENLNSIRLTASSDYHLGNIGSDISYAYVMADYMKKESIHVGLILGDLIDGEHMNINVRKMSLKEQLAYLSYNFPMDPYINYLVLLGNHERHSLKYHNEDIAPLIARDRVDFAVMGYGYQVLKIQNDFIHLQHKLCDSSYKGGFPQVNANNFMLLGHSHELKVVPQKFFKLYVLPMCDLYHADYAYYPGFLDLILKMNHQGKINEVLVKEVIVVDNKPFINNEFNIDIIHHTTDYREKSRVLKRKI